MELPVGHIQYMQTYTSSEALDCDNKAELNSNPASQIDFLNTMRKITEPLNCKCWKVENNMSFSFLRLELLHSRVFLQVHVCMMFNVMPALTQANPLGCNVSNSSNT